MISNFVPSLIAKQLHHRANEVIYRFIDYSRERDGEVHELTWAQFGARLRAIGARLQHITKREDRVAILAPQGLDYVTAFFGALYAGNIAVPLFSPDEPGHTDRLRIVLEDCKPTAILTSSGSAEACRNFFHHLPAKERPRIIAVDAIPDLLPFIPMIPLVVLVQNLAYDLSMLTLPWDRVDDEDLRQPRSWDSRGLGTFMTHIGPLSSIFDISTFALMWFVFAANSPEYAALFQSGWFVESIISQTMIVHLLRTGRIPFVQSRASIPVLLATGAVCLFGLMLPFSGWGASLGLVPLPWSYFPWLVLTLVAYCGVTQLAKHVYIRHTNHWI